MDISTLNQTYGIAGVLEFKEAEGGLPAAFITSSLANAVVTLYGAHVLSYRPAGKVEALWMSTQSWFEDGKPIRGGIPVCFPWFGPHATDSNKPQHGFARLNTWNVAGARVLSDGCVELRLTLNDTPSTKELWPHSFMLEMIVNVGASLDVMLCCTNTGAEPFTYSDALHSYFAVSDIGNVKIIGLAGSAYYKGFGTELLHQDEQVLQIGKEENRRYVDTTAECTIEDSATEKSVRVAKKGSRVTVVWNPWDLTAKNIPDMPDDGYTTMICVEAVNAYHDAVTVQPQGNHTLGTTITIS